MSKNFSKSDDGSCSRWKTICEDQHERKRGLALVNRMVKDPALAEDILHDTYVCFLKREDSDEKEDMSNYFLKSMKNRGLTELGKRTRSMLTDAVLVNGPLTDESDDRSVPTPARGLNPEMDTERYETNNRYLRIVRLCSQKLTDREKALLLSHLRGYTNEEIADAWDEDLKLIQKEMNAVIAKMRYRCRREDKRQGGQ